MRASQQRPPLSSILERKAIHDFAYQLDRLDDLPSSQIEMIKSSIPEDDGVQLIIDAPHQITYDPGEKKHFWSLPSQRRTVSPSWIIVLTKTRLLIEVIQFGEVRGDLVSIPIDCIYWLRRGTELLYSWFECAWFAADRNETIRIIYNTVSFRYFEDLTNSLRLLMEEVSKPVSGPCPSPDLNLECLPFKFRNMLKLHQLLPSEQVDFCLYSPTVMRCKHWFFGKKVLPGIVLSITETGFLVAEEVSSDSTGEPGMSYTFIPRKLIRGMVCDSSSNSCLLQVNIGWSSPVQKFSIQFPLRFKTQLSQLSN
jgi:hypothetical protein